MNIYTIFTGGTIGSHLAPAGNIRTNHAAPFQLLEYYNQTYPNSITFHTEEPYYILSENLCAPYLLQLIGCLNQILRTKKTDGIIITHGTDTLQYTAAILSYLFDDAAVPIFLVSSDYVLADARANGLTNFHYAVRFIEEKRGSGVFVSYCNQGGSATIHRGSRLQTPLSYSADVFSIADSWYGRYEQNNYLSNPNLIITPGQKRLPVSPDTVRLTEYPPILRIFPYVGMGYPDIPSGTKAILHESFHSGTIRVEGMLKDFADTAAQRHIPIFLTGLDSHQAHYETVEQYRQSGIIPLTNRAAIAQYCKLWLAIDNDLDILTTMSTPAAEDTL